MDSIPTPPQTYRAILQGSQITWVDIPPDLPATTEIYVAIASLTPKASRGQAMAASLEKLAQINPFNDIDPLAWQQETRQDRVLPGRE
jgi:hypothetical protein